MEVNQSKKSSQEDFRSILERGAAEVLDKKEMFSTIQKSLISMNELPLEKLEENLMSHLLPCIRKLFIEIYDESKNINSREHIQKLDDNLIMSISLTDFIGKILEQVSLLIGDSSIRIFGSIFKELPVCFYLTYKHCKESQEKYQNLRENCEEILELFKKNQDYYMRFLDILNNVYIDGTTNNAEGEIIIQVLQNILNIIEVLFGMSVKALADTWKKYCIFIEKYHLILSQESIYCVKEIQIIKQQIKKFMDIALDNDEEKQRLQYIKLSGFLLKVAIKIFSKFWEQLQIHCLEELHNFLCTVYDYSLEFLGKWNLNINIQHCLQTCLFGVLTPFSAEFILCETFLKQLLSNIDKSHNRSCGCMILDLKILNYLIIQPSNSLDYICFSDMCNHIFQDISHHSVEFHSYPSKSETFLFRNLCSTICQCVVNHNSFYNVDVEHSLLQNIIGNDLWCNFLASEVWIGILRSSSEHSRMDVVLWLVNSINESIVEMTFDSRKVLLLQRFMKSLLNILTQNENINILKKFPPQRYPQLWRILGFYHFNAHQSMLLDLLMNSLIQRTDALENIESGTEILELLEILKLIVTMNFQSVSSGKEKLLEIMQTLWGLNLEEVNTNNIFLSLFICKLCQATLTIIEHFTDEQVHCILAKMKALSCFKLELCFLLNAISTRPTKHYNAQNKLNSLISDIFEILLMERNSVVKELSVETFQQFAHNKNYIIVNNVSRMLPNLNLKQYMSGDNCDINGYFKTLEVIFCDHKCLKETPADVKTVLARTSSFLVETSPLTLQAPIKQFSNYSLSINSFDGVPQNKKIRLTEDVQEDDTISEILLRIKSEIKCLNKVLVKEPLTPKNAQIIEMLINQLHRISGYQ